GDGVDIKRVVAKQARLDPVVQEHLYGALLPLERRLADAGQPGVGAQADEQVVAQPGVGQEGFEVDDLHAPSPGGNSPGKVPLSRKRQSATAAACGLAGHARTAPRPPAYRTAMGLPGE